MATATKKVQPAASSARTVRGRSETASLEVHVYQANGGDYHWEIVERSGDSLAHSGSFASRDAAEEAARYVCEGVPSVRLEAHVTNERQTVAV